jgi:hypothetical protein
VCVFDHLNLHTQLTDCGYIFSMLGPPSTPHRNEASARSSFRWLFWVHIGFAALWALLDLIFIGGCVILGGFAGATVSVDPPEEGFTLPTGMFLILAIPATLHLSLAWGAHQRASWIGKGTMLIGLATMLLFPVGTLLGLYLFCLSGRDLQSRDVA